MPFILTLLETVLWQGQGLVVLGPCGDLDAPSASGQKKCKL